MLKHDIAKLIETKKPEGCDAEKVDFCSAAGDMKKLIMKSQMLN